MRLFNVQIISQSEKSGEIDVTNWVGDARSEEEALGAAIKKHSSIHPGDPVYATNVFDMTDTAHRFAEQHPREPT